MGRTIRKVPPNYEHAKDERGHYVPVFDQTFEAAAKEWKEGFLAHNSEEHDGSEYWEDEGGPPDRESYRTYKDDEATWFQVWENVSEGTPTTPPFATKEELIEHLVSVGEFGSLHYPSVPWEREYAVKFVEDEYVPSLVMFRHASGQVDMCGPTFGGNAR